MCLIPSVQEGVHTQIEWQLEDNLREVHDLLQTLRRSILSNQEEYFHTDATVIDVIDERLKLVSDRIDIILSTTQSQGEKS